MKVNMFFGAMASSALLLGGVACAQSAAVFTFGTTPEGRFRAVVTYDQLPAGKCRAALLARSETAGGQIGDIVEIARKKVSDTVVRWKRKDLPRVKKEGGLYPVVHMMVRTECGGEVLDSNVFARRIRCGQNRKVTGLKKERVTIERWLKFLKAKLS